MAPIGSNWVDVPGSSVMIAKQMLVPVSTTNGGAFYRLACS
jgi:hypothetical protein